MIHKFLTFGEPTKATGRIYSKEHTRLPDAPASIWVTFDHQYPMPLENIAGIVKDIEIRPDGIYGVLDIFPESRHGAIITALQDAKVDMKYQAGGLGMVDENNVVTDYMLTHVAVVAKVDPINKVVDDDNLSQGQSS